MNRDEEKEIADQLAMLIDSCPIRPQLKMALAVTLLTHLAMEFAEHKKLKDDTKFTGHEEQPGDTCFSVALRFIGFFDDAARRTGTGSVEEYHRQCKERGIHDITTGLPK